MPTTLTGILLFVILLLPGLTYSMVRELRSGERRVSAFRESGAVIFGSVIAEIVVLAIFAIVRISWPKNTPDIGRLIRDRGSYVESHYALLASWAVSLLLLASVLAGITALFVKRHSSTLSGWSMLFEYWHKDHDAHVGCVLEDGAFIEGVVASYNLSPDDLADRDLILIQPIRYRPPGALESQAYPAGAVCLSAKKIVTMFVSHLPTAEEEPAVPEGEGSPQAA
ncbi:DUF6338 family protein [Streptomyces phaeochromogenes]|uniref:DUF6338 family protein n=1 Tax=Streptomyces phaeochromogenes TaxID=1923 RepID=UPI002DD7D601|nr:DUF6338 family protein [Streptomyces phaeochromogenes]WRZ30742.1 DUF6338 family protein [Streptomyces phaeochromogenes]